MLPSLSDLLRHPSSLPPPLHHHHHHHHPQLVNPHPTTIYSSPNHKIFPTTTATQWILPRGGATVFYTVALLSLLLLHLSLPSSAAAPHVECFGDDLEEETDDPLLDDPPIQLTDLPPSPSLTQSHSQTHHAPPPPAQSQPSDHHHPKKPSSNFDEYCHALFGILWFEISGEE